MLGFRWGDIDLHRGTIALNRGLVAIAYQLHETRGKTRNARRPIDLDATTVDLLQAWHTWQTAEQLAVGIDSDGWVFADAAGQPIHPHAISQAFERTARGAGVPVIRLHDIRHTHATLLVQSGVPVKVVIERLGHATAGFTIETYQHVMPGMQADAAAVSETLAFSLVRGHFDPVTRVRQVPVTPCCSLLFTVGLVHGWYIGSGRSGQQLGRGRIICGYRHEVHVAVVVDLFDAHDRPEPDGPSDQHVTTRCAVPNIRATTSGWTTS